jgi:hypothetical protein
MLSFVGATLGSLEPCCTQRVPWDKGSGRHLERRGGLCLWGLQQSSSCSMAPPAPSIAHSPLMFYQDDAEIQLKAIC